MDLIKGENANLFVMNHYHELLELVNNGNNELYSDLEINIISKLLFENIVNKINNLDKLSLNEAYLFVEKLVMYVSDALDIRIPCNFSIVDAGDNRLPSDSMGVFKTDNYNNFEILYSRDLLKYLRGLEKIEYDEGSEEYIQTLIVSIIVTLITIPHELVHTKQFEERYTGEINLRNLLLTLEHILSKGDYYSLNAPFVYEECYADVRAVELLFEFLRQYNILNDSDLFDMIYDLMKKQYVQSMLSMKEYVVYEDGKDTNIITDNYLLFGSSRYVKENPKFLNSFPLLKFVFDENGDLLKISSILEKCMEILKEMEKTFGIDNEKMKKLFIEIDDIYSFILKSYCFIYGKEFVIDEIKLFLENNLLEDDFVNNMLDICNDFECIEVNELNSNVKRRVLELRNL